ncbi:MAG: hypothetical protein PHH77_01270 [Victivallaceae bacterium]|nr:hypothetical protein [Victivallaceae bacterium]
MSRKLMFLLSVSLSVIVFSGCSTPQVSSHGIVDVDSEVIEGGVGSNEVRTVAQKMGPAVLALPAVANNAGVTRIAIAPMKNSSRFVVDTNIFMKKLRLELNRYSQGRVRFFSQQNNARKTRHEILENRREDEVDASLDAVAEQFVQSYLVSNSKKQLRLAVIPVLNTNLVGMNADSATALLRNKIVEASKGKVVFTMPGTVAGADYLLTGQFIAVGMKKEGMVNLAEYIGVMNKRIKEGKSLEVYQRPVNKNSGIQINLVNQDIFLNEPELFKQIQASANLRANPNVTKKLNLLVVSAQDKMAVFEKLFVIEKKITEGTEKAKFILSGEITSLTKKQEGKVADYLLITMQLVSPESNEVVWEDGYEVKKSSATGIVYQ